MLLLSMFTLPQYDFCTFIPHNEKLYVSVFLAFNFILSKVLVESLWNALVHKSDYNVTKQSSFILELLFIKEKAVSASYSDFSNNTTMLHPSYWYPCQSKGSVLSLRITRLMQHGIAELCNISFWGLEYSNY